MVGVKTYVCCIVTCMVKVGCSQLTFPDATTSTADGATSTINSSPPHDVPQMHPGQTRLFGLDGLLGAVFGDDCSRCSVNDQVLANRCCQQGRRHCCQFLQPVVGFVRPPIGPGFGQPGVVGGFQPGPPGFIPGGSSSALISGTGSSGGEKRGVCRDGTRGVQVGFNRFVGAQCVLQCRADLQCPGIQKCCSVGCSTACQIPIELGAQGFQGNGFQTGGGFAAGGAGGFPGNGFQTGGGFAAGGAGGFPVGSGFGAGGFVQPTSKTGFCPRKINPITDPLGSLGSFLGLRSADGDPTATSHKPVDDTTGAEGQSIDANPQRQKRQSGNEQLQNNAPNTRFFGPFCRNRCFNDFDCPGNLKCCIGKLDDCMQCVNPQFF